MQPKEKRTYESETTPLPGLRLELAKKPAPDEIEQPEMPFEIRKRTLPEDLVLRVLERVKKL